MAARGVILTYEAVHYWCRKFGQAYANQLRHRRPRPGDKWHLDEMSLTINKERHYLWRAVDQEGYVLDILVQRRRDKRAAKRFFHKLLKGLTYVPRVIITDKLRSYGAARNTRRSLRKRWPATAPVGGEVAREGGERRHGAGEEDEQPETATRRGSLLSALMGGAWYVPRARGRNIKVADEPGLLAEWREVKLERAAHQ